MMVSRPLRECFETCTAVKVPREGVKVSYARSEQRGGDRPDAVQAKAATEFAKPGGVAELTYDTRGRRRWARTGHRAQRCRVTVPTGASMGHRDGH